MTNTVRARMARAEPYICLWGDAHARNKSDDELAKLPIMKLMDDTAAMDVLQARSRFQEYFVIVEKGALRSAHDILEAVRAFRSSQKKVQLNFALLLSIVALEMLFRLAKTDRSPGLDLIVDDIRS